MSATNAERAVIEAARRLFTTPDQRERVERLGVLKAAVDAIELEYTAGALDAPTAEQRFRSALEIVGASRTVGVYERMWAAGATPFTLHAMGFDELLDIQQAGPSTYAAFAAALEHAGLGVPSWAKDSRHVQPFFGRLASYRDTLKLVRDGAL